MGRSSGESKANPAGDKVRYSRPNSGATDYVAEWLVGLVRSKSLKPGAKLPSERELCAQFSVSRPVVREALSRLKTEGLIVIQHGRGAFVAQGNQRQMFRMRDVSLADKDELAHVIELLIAIEVTATKLAAQKRSPDDLRRIRRALIGMEYAIANDQLGDQEDYEFHQSIVDATHNPHFRELSEYLEHRVRRLIRRARQNTADSSDDLVKAVQLEHKAIFHAIEARDPEAASLAAEAHLQNAGRRLAVYLNEGQPHPRARAKRSA
jgi:GntR family transcriptional repressor for pyruvate dehydrogenase complex